MKEQGGHYQTTGISQELVSYEFIIEYGSIDLPPKHPGGCGSRDAAAQADWHWPTFLSENVLEHFIFRRPNPGPRVCRASATPLSYFPDLLDVVHFKDRWFRDGHHFHKAAHCLVVPPLYGCLRQQGIKLLDLSIHLRFMTIPK